MSVPIVAADGLACEMGEHRLFEDLNISLRAGDILLVTGPNGSGKSTLLRILAGLRDGTAGTIRLDGAAHYLGHTLGLKPALTGTDHLRFWQGLDGGAHDDNDPFAISSFASLPVGVLSRGQRQRLALSRLVRSRRPVWLLDEPSGPLDAEGEAALAAVIDAHAGRAGVAIVATHRALPLARPTRELDLA